DGLLEPGPQVSQGGTARPAKHSCLYSAHRARAYGPAAGVEVGSQRRVAVCSGAVFVPPDLLHHEPGSLLSTADRSILCDSGGSGSNADWNKKERRPIGRPKLRTD